MTEETTPVVEAPTIIAPAPYAPPTEEKKAYLAALAAAQGEFEPILRNRQVVIRGKEGRSDYSFVYAELGEVLAKTRPACSKNGLSLRSRILPGTADGVWLQSVLAHAGGYEDVSEVFVSYGDDIKQFGGRLTYMRRFIGSCQLGIASEADTDDDGDGRGEETSFGNRPPPAPPPAARAKPQGKPLAAKPAALPPVQADSTPGGPPPGPPQEEDTQAPAGNDEERISEGQAKWLKGKMSAYFDDAQAAAFLAKHGAAGGLAQFPASQFNAARAELMAL